MKVTTLLTIWVPFKFIIMNLSLSEIFFNITFVDYPQLLVKVLIFLALPALLIYLIYLILSKTVKRKESSDYQLPLNFLWSLVIFLLLFGVYCFFLVKRIGLEAFRLSDPYFYLGAFPQLFIVLVIAVIFFWRLSVYEKSIKAT